MAVLFLLITCILSCSAEFADDIQVFEKECLMEESFFCMSGGCVEREKRCDGHMDCEDGTDENFCEGIPPDEDLCTSEEEYFCQDRKKCIPRVWMCNNNTDCDDGSDEANCTSLPELSKNSTCKGFLCSDGKCISTLWACDGRRDCTNDEDIVNTCRHTLLPHTVNDGLSCEEFPALGGRNYKCLDMSFCLSSDMMCDGMKDCRDGSDEGTFCINWQSMCSNYTCLGNDTACTPTRAGPVCYCAQNYKAYNTSSQRCEDVDECAEARPMCSHTCENRDGYYKCHCDAGYTLDKTGYLCYAPDPEAMLFYSVNNEIRYLKVKSKQQVTVATGIKQAHGITYDGKYLYWVDIAQGHQAISRAHLENIEETKETLVGLGLEDPGDIALDWLGGHIYFSDTERRIIAACTTDGSMCTTVRRGGRPRFVTLDVKNGRMFWSDINGAVAVIMSGSMDGSHTELLVDSLASYATGLALDSHNNRLYFVEHTIMVVKIDDKQVYSLFTEPFHHPYAISVFENTVFWSDWTSNTIQSTDKLHASSQKRNVFEMHSLVYGMHIYHPVLMSNGSNACERNKCSHLCLLASNTTYSCACPDGMQLVNPTTCLPIFGYRPEYLIVGGGSSFTRIQYDTLGNPESHATYFDIGRVQAMAYDSLRDVLFVYDGQRKTINNISMSEFTLGITHVFLYHGLENVVDMDYDPVSDALYILDAGRHCIEVISLRTQRVTIVYRFTNDELPVSLCLLPDYGRMLVSVVESDMNNEIHIDSLGMDGEDRQHLILNNLKGGHVSLRYSQTMDNVFIADEGNRVIDYVHPEGSGREKYRDLSSTVTGLAVTDSLVFWTDRRTPRLFWSEVHETTNRIRRIQLSIFPNNTQLHIQATSPLPNPNSTFMQHTCFKNNPCSHICVQTPRHMSTKSLKISSIGGKLTIVRDKQSNEGHKSSKLGDETSTGYKCLCPSGMVLEDGKCTNVANCNWDENICHKSNTCVKKFAICNGVRDCPHGEDEEDCHKVNKCSPGKVLCNDQCINKNTVCKKASKPTEILTCSPTEYLCSDGSMCIDRSMLCDRHTDCPSASDEASCDTLACLHTEFMCASRACILSSWRCDGDEDCADGSDEIDCANQTCGLGYYRCRSGDCIEMHRRCDNQQDCYDFSDEEECDEPEFLDVPEPSCAGWEFACEHNKSLCLPLTAKCNGKVECPGSTDENGCDFRCSPHKQFECKQEARCLPLGKVCNGWKDCSDGSDETPEACTKVNRTSRLYPTSIFPPEECHSGYLCDNGQCVEQRQVCNQITDCFDGTDENGLCFTACENNKCEYACQATPVGPTCVCRQGYRAEDKVCVDIDECASEVCSQGCHNTPGSFLCSCHHGYALRSDRRSCKAVRGNMSILYVTGNTVRATAPGGFDTVLYNDPKVSRITGIAYDVRREKLYVTSAEAKKMTEVNSTHNDITITNIGQPTKVSVDWVTGNVYFIDATPDDSCVRVCHVGSKRCARLQTIPMGAEVTSLVVDPKSRLLFYCVSRDQESVVWSSTLDGQTLSDLASFGNCTGLALQSFSTRLYVAETGPSRILHMDILGDHVKKLLTNDPHLQAPHSLAIFEDHVYFLVANSFKLNRCLLYGKKTCETFMARIFNANTFVIRHESVQRDDLTNICEGFVCDNVCVLGESGPVCVCYDGTLSKDGKCLILKEDQLPQFNGWTQQKFAAPNRSSFVIISSVLGLFALYLCVFIYYHFIYRPNRERAAISVRFHNTATQGEEYTTTAIDMPAERGTPHEFVNPLQFVTNIWRQSMRQKTRPVGTADLAVDVPILQDYSDTESDLDEKENMKLLY